MFDFFAYFERRLTQALVNSAHNARRILAGECEAEEARLIETTATRIEEEPAPSGRKPRRTAVR